MTALTTLRDHARAMATAQHKPECPVDLPFPDAFTWRSLRCGREDGHKAHRFERNDLRWNCPGRCPGCVTDDERALWKQQADELDGYLGRDEEGLF